MLKRILVVIAVFCTALIAVPSTASAGPKSCDNRSNNTIDKLLECVTVDGVREHQAALQAIADANGGIRTSGTPGYDESVAYVADRLEAAGYDVTIQSFEFAAFILLGPATLEQTAPGSVSYAEGTDFDVMSQSDPGDVTGAVTPVDLQLFLGNTSTSGCEATDFAGFPAGSIALVQRGACAFQTKAENAAAAGAAGVIIFNQGNTDGRKGLINATLSANYTGGIPVMEATYDLGETLAGIAGLEMRLAADVFRGDATSFNVLAETAKGDSDNTIMVGAHLDSVNAGPGIQDNGSGSAAILEVAEQMAKVNTRNNVRFAWWGAEESGLVGSTHYVDTLPQSELDQISLYLNFDMIGSPNYFFGIYDGDDSDAVGAGPGPAGSAEIEDTSEAYYDAIGQPYQGTDFSGRSDYGPFIAVGIPAGGLFTGAEGIKTAAEVALYGGTAGDQYDPCYHLACDTFENISLFALEVNSDAVAYATLNYAMSTELINGGVSKGNFRPGTNAHTSPANWLAMD